MKKKKKLIKLIKIWSLSLFGFFTIILMLVNIYFQYQHFINSTKTIKSDYIREQKETLKSQVEMVVNQINNERSRNEEFAKHIAKSKINEACLIAESIYTQTKNYKTNEEIKKIIIETLRPIRFMNENGSYFITDLNGKELFFTDKLKMEGLNLISFQDQEGKFVLKELIDIARKKGEGFCSYYWTNPKTENDHQKKISFVKKMDNLDCIIGTSLYIDDIHSNLQNFLREHLSDFRFGKYNRGYIFISDLIDINGGNKFAKLIVNANRPDLVGSYLSDEYKDADGKQFRKEYLKGLRKDGECFVKYSYKKFDQLEQVSKISFFKLTSNKEFIVGAGFYLDDVETEVSKMRIKLKSTIIKEVLSILTLSFVIAILILLLLKVLNKRIQNDFELFISFFQKMASFDEPIIRDNIRFSELDTMAENANKMLQNKITAEQNLINEKNRLLVTIRSIGDGVITTDKEGKIVLLNNVAEKLTGWKTFDAKGKSLEEVFKIVNSETNKPVNNPVSKVLESGKIIGLANHTVLISKNNSKYQIADSAAPIKDYEGNISGVVLVFRDVTEEYSMQKKLIDNERNYRLITEGTSDFISKIDLSGKIIYASPSHSILGYSQEELYGKLGFNFMHKDDAKKLQELLVRVLNNPKQEIPTIDFRFKDKGNNYHHLESKVNFIFDKNGLPESMILISRDITKNEKERKILKDSEKTFKALFNNPLASIYIQDEEGMFLELSQGALEMYGYSREEVIGQSVEFLSAPNKNNLVLINNLIHKAYNGKPQQFEYWGKRKNGEIFPKIVRVSRGYYFGEKVLFAFSIELTELKKAEQELKESEIYNKALFYDSHIPLIIMDTETYKFIDGNNAALKIYGFDSKDDFLGKTPLDVSDEIQYNGEKSSVLALEKIEEAMENGSSFFEWRHKRPNGEIWDAEVHLMRIQLNNKKILQFSLLDITNRKKTEEELQKMDKLQSVGTLAGGIAHDFNNILTGLYGNISIARMKLTKDHQCIKYLESAEKSMNRATNLTKQLLTFSKGGNPIFEDISIDELIKKVVKFDLSGSNLKAIFTQSDNLWLAEVDKGQMQQVFSNLTINANQATPNGGFLRINLENVNILEKEVIGLRAGKYIKVTVKDEGIGIDSKNLNRIFDPYFTTKHTGHGLGMATVFSIMKKHNGLISVESELGKGTTFTLYLPASELETKLINQTDGEIKIHDSARILIMDDEDMVCDICSLLLETLGYTSEKCYDGKEAIEIYTKSLNSPERFNAIIMDLTIPGGMGGKEAVKEILKIDKEAKVIVSSGYSSGTVLSNYAEYGFKGIIGKPYKIEKLQKVLEEVLG